MFTISVPDMMCQNCVKRITNALNEAELKFSVELESRTVTIDGCQHCLKTAMEELEDLGFTPEVKRHPGDSDTGGPGGAARPFPWKYLSIS